ncbi:hypothetical protein GWR56_10440 [Mucilaginibacter sp. 14171R-50]|uniref:hypothetical protein n=1 Tax=Mucilaginibacter sp. 14171R-50 TaxID=2703789 RepID=UPI00138B5C14|nr:hypothetical protein [Mucilaginibacter sp. 14171R-50]QHS55931.1 hypothetical protein GWR56_10440 [Mucilaginibacter sp. 14171R-50]
MGLFSFFLKLLKFKPGWNGTPEMFLAMVMEMQSRNNKEFSVREVLHWGEVMQKVIKVNLAPYKDFADLLKNGKPDFSMVEKLRGKMDELNHRRDLKKAIYGENADLGDDDVMKSNAEGAVFARNMVKDLSKYVEFPDDDQKTIDEF